MRTRLILALAAVLCQGGIAGQADGQERSGAPSGIGQARSPAPLPREGFFRRMTRLLTRAQPTPAEALIRGLRRTADPAAARKLGVTFMLRDQRQQNLSRTSLHELKRILKVAGRATGSSKTGDAILVHYATHWMPSLSLDDLHTLMDRTPDRPNAVRDRLISLYADHHFFGKDQKDARATLEQLGDDFFRVTRRAGPETQDRLLKRYAAAFGEPPAWGASRFVSWIGGGTASRSRSAKGTDSEPDNDFVSPMQQALGGSIINMDGNPYTPF